MRLSLRSALLAFVVVLFVLTVYLIRKSSFPAPATLTESAAKKPDGETRTFLDPARAGAKAPRPGGSPDGATASAPSPRAVDFELKSYCRIKSANTGIPLDGKLKIVAFPYEVDEDGQSGFVAFVSSSGCPESGFSKITIDGLGRVKSVMDCRRAQANQVAINSGIQGNIVDRPSTEHILNLAISGNGFFVTQCDARFFLQREGELEIRNGTLWHGGCELLDRQGHVFRWTGEPLDESGCARSGVCLAISDPSQSGTKIIDRTTLEDEDPFRNLILAPKIFSDAREDISDPRTGPMGPNWHGISTFVPPRSCEGQ